MAERVTVAAYDGVQSLDVSGPVEVLAGANRVLGRMAYDVVVCAPAREVRTESGLRLAADPLPAPVTGGLVLVPGGFAAVERTKPVDDVTEWLGASTPDRVATVCTGAFPAARAGNSSTAIRNLGMDASDANRRPSLLASPNSW